MGSLFRSEEMTLAQLYLQADSAYYCVSELGELGLVQFRDLNPEVSAFHRKYVSEVRRCDEMERKLRFLENEASGAGIPVLDKGNNPEAPPPSDMMELESKFGKLEAEICEINTNHERLKRNFLELTELKHMLRQTTYFFDEAASLLRYGREQPQRDEQKKLLDDYRPGSSPLSFVAGVVSRTRIVAFERVLWRACRGNVFLRHEEIDCELKDPVTGAAMYKNVFILFFQGEQLRSRVKKICEGFQATQYPCPETTAERREMAMGVSTRIEDLGVVLIQTTDHRYRVLQGMAKDIKDWANNVKKIKAIYHTLNMLNVDVTHKCLIGECWCPVADLESIRAALRRGFASSGSSVMPILNVMTSSMNPPTYNKVNKFTAGFQNIIDAYGVATYREVNPAPFSIITFPFLFAVMFGDCGHGLMMLLFALVLVLNEKKLATLKGGEIFGTFYGGRYIILLMGLFSIYTGLVYNDCFSKSFNIFGSSWSVNKIELKHVRPGGTLSLRLGSKGKHSDFDIHNPYPLGLDPIWQVASNKLTFTNSYKMKMSIVLGVSQMMFGVILGLFNHLHFRRRINIIGMFVPEVLFLGCIFGYLVFMIFFKWLAVDSDTLSDKAGAPSLLIMLINMFLSFGKEIKDSQGEFYRGQVGIQSFLVVVALLAVPWMLFTKPVYVYMQRNHLKRRYTALADKEENGSFSKQARHDNTEEEEDVEEESIGDIFIHQAIHTIEFCLGCISNTASYLRLWALSLAHAELSEVLWEMMLHIGLDSAARVAGPLLLFSTFAIWTVLTIAILLIMEGLSAFLHALRLHWVEFNNKFYRGEGYKFHPFSFELILEGGGDDV